MPTWTRDELDEIEAADELDLASMRHRRHAPATGDDVGRPRRRRSPSIVAPPGRAPRRSSSSPVQAPERRPDGEAHFRNTLEVSAILRRRFRNTRPGDAVAGIHATGDQGRRDHEAVSPWHDLRDTALTHEARPPGTRCLRAGEDRTQPEHDHRPLVHAAQVLFPGAAERAEERMFGAAR
jgi:hypothetical protein